MTSATKIEHDIYYVGHPSRPGWFCGITVVIGARSLGLVDTGYENTPEDYLLPFLQEIGRNPSDISAVYNTHGDGDHVLGNAAVKRLSGATIACHEKEAEAIGNVDVPLSDGQTIDLGDRTFTVVHCPGHRPGNTCLFDKQTSLLLAGDTIVGEKSELIRMGSRPYIASLQKISALSPVKVIMAHPFPPAGKIVLEGSEITDMIQASIRVAEAAE